MPYTLIDGVQRNAENPRAFQIPTTEQVLQVGRGNFVKVGAEFPNHGRVNAERFWVRVTAIVGGRFKGKVNNDLVYTPLHGLSFNDEIEFESKHILDIFPQREQ